MAQSEGKRLVEIAKEQNKLDEYFKNHKNSILDLDYAYKQNWINDSELSGYMKDWGITSKDEFDNMVNAVEEANSEVDLNHYTGEFTIEETQT